MKGVERIHTPEVAEPPGASWSNCLRIGRELVFSGVTARGPHGTIGGDSMQDQTRACLDRIFAQLAAAGGGPGNVYKLVIYVTDIARKDEVNAARKAAFSGTYPASTLLEVSGFVFPDLLVEIDACANLDISLT
jgi:enamine deaminase RidA (YjgF/YER057c/UK114 family)